jgi:isoquinoline 1-oxidoreductase beta subunit
MALTRRQVLWVGAGTVGALVVGWGVAPPRSRLTHDLFDPANNDEVSINAWVRIGADNSVTLFMPQCELGQGVHTGLAMLLAEELECSLSQIRIEDAPIHPLYNNLEVSVDGLPFHPDATGRIKAVSEHLTAKVMREVGVMVTGGSSSIRDLWQVLREAGVMARETLRSGAADIWSVPIEEITLREGVARRARQTLADSSLDDSLSFGDIVARAGDRLRAPRTLPPLKSPDDWRLLGQSPLRLDSASKIDGTAKFAADFREPGMCYALIRLLESLDGTIDSLEPQSIDQASGVRAVHILEPASGTVGGVAVVADKRWLAEKAARKLRWRATAGRSAQLDDRTVTSEWRARLDQDTDAAIYFECGDTAALEGNSARIVAQYSVPYLAHAPMETPSCTIKYSLAPGEGSVGSSYADVWVATQIPGRARALVAKRLGLDEQHVTVHNVYAGGSFGRRLELDFIDQAAQIAALHPGVMVQCQWSRADDLQHDFYRPLAVANLQGWLAPVTDRPERDESANPQRIAGLATHSISQSIVAQVMPRIFGGGVSSPSSLDKTQVEGVFDQAYDIEHQRIAHTSLELPVPVGFWRSVGHSHQAFFLESFFDELAAAAQADPLEFRLAHLTRHPRHRRVLEALGEYAQWGQSKRTEDGRPIAQGIAINRSFGSIVGQVHEVSMDEARRLRVQRVIVVVDCGRVVHPGAVEQQMQSSVIYGLSAALFGEIAIREGQVQAGNFDGYPVLRMAQTPVIEVHILPSEDPPGGVGEPGLPPTAPALANAVARLTGIRPRRLPLLDASGIVRDLSAGA